MCVIASMGRVADLQVVFFEEAKEDARKLDAEFALTGRVKGLLHGVPTSVKDQCAFFPSLPEPLSAIPFGCA